MCSDDIEVKKVSRFVLLEQGRMLKETGKKPARSENMTGKASPNISRLRETHISFFSVCVSVVQIYERIINSFKNLEKIVRCHDICEGVATLVFGEKKFFLEKRSKRRIRKGK